jgi:hypothetical protein
LKFSCLILAQVHSEQYSEDDCNLVHIMEARSQNVNCWSTNVNHHDNGTMIIGSMNHYPCPLLITMYMYYDIPFVLCHIYLSFSSKLLQGYPRLWWMKKLKLTYYEELFIFAPNWLLATQHKSSSGNQCDHQRITDWLGIKGCGCYDISTNSTSLVSQHTIDFWVEPQVRKKW